jgi:hypothetical protein
MTFTIRSPLALLMLAACAACASEAPAPGAEPASEVRFALNGSRHRQTTRAGVSAWVDTTAADAFEAMSTIGDSDPVTNPRSETHFDNCYWEEGRDWILLKRREAVTAALAFLQSGANADRQHFFASFGYVLHAAEDFYAHSNWVETHEPGVLANFSDPGVPRPDGWYSGTYDNPSDTGPNAGAAHCPPLTPSHTLLNKDGAAGPLKDEAFLDATLSVTVELQKLIAAVRTASPSHGDAALAKLGFLSREPSHTPSRNDHKQALTLAAAGKGLFTPALFCRPGTFVSGFTQRVEEVQGDGDDSALNAVALLCSDRDGKSVERLTAWEGVWGTWSAPASCPAKQFITRGQIKVEPPQIAGDGTAANASRFACGDGTRLAADNDGTWGSWGAEGGCATAEAMCGVEIAYQPPQDGADDVAMTGMRMHCCVVDAADGGTGGSAGSSGSGGAGGAGGTAGDAGSAGEAGSSGTRDARSDTGARDAAARDVRGAGDGAGAGGSGGGAGVSDAGSGGASGTGAAGRGGTAGASGGSSGGQYAAADAGTASRDGAAGTNPASAGRAGCSCRAAGGDAGGTSHNLAIALFALALVSRSLRRGR